MANYKSLSEAFRTTAPQAAGKTPRPSRSRRTLSEAFRASSSDEVAVDEAAVAGSDDTDSEEDKDDDDDGGGDVPADESTSDPPAGSGATVAVPVRRENRKLRLNPKSPADKARLAAYFRSRPVWRPRAAVKSPDTKGR